MVFPCSPCKLYQIMPHSCFFLSPKFCQLFKLCNTLANEFAQQNTFNKISFCGNQVNQNVFLKTKFMQRKEKSGTFKSDTCVLSDVPGCEMNNLLCTCDNVEASFVKGSHEQLKPDDGVDDDDKEDEEGNVHQGDDCHQDGIHHNLQTCTAQLVFATKTSI